MNRNELVDAVAGKADLSKSIANKAVEAVFESITGALKGGTEVRLGGFGTFSIASRAASEGRDPHTGEKIAITASKQAKLKPEQSMTVVVSLMSEYLPDGSFHVYSPDVPGFHVVEPQKGMSHEELFYKKVRPILGETMTRRVTEAKVGREVRFWDQPIVEIHNFIPDELRHRLGGERSKVGIPAQLIAEIK